MNLLPGALEIFGAVDLEQATIIDVANLQERCGE